MNNMTEEDEWKRLADIVATALIERDKAKDDLSAISGLLARGLKREAELTEMKDRYYELQTDIHGQYRELEVKLEEMTVSRNTWRAEANRLKKLKKQKSTSNKTTKRIPKSTSGGQDTALHIS
jgi:predicted nuclease with TOPRIM domain